MLKLATKPENVISIPSLRVEVFNFKGDWYSLHLNGLGYYALLIDGRSVYNAFRRKNNRLSMDIHNNLKSGNDNLILRN